MKATVICDSTYGNTARVAMAIADGLGGHGVARVVPASDAVTADQGRPDLVVVGGPTHRRALSDVLRAFLDRQPRASLRGVPAATFDTRYHMRAFLSGSAARQASRRLRRAGCRLVTRPESFFIERDRPAKGQKRRHEVEHLEPGEIQRAREWGRQLAALVGP
ncbi:MAG: flavodoxin family protein [Dermatophilaceae bacterium]